MRVSERARIRRPRVISSAQPNTGTGVAHVAALRAGSNATSIHVEAKRRGTPLHGYKVTVCNGPAAGTTATEYSAPGNRVSLSCSEQLSTARSGMARTQCHARTHALARTHTEGGTAGAGRHPAAYLHAGRALNSVSHAHTKRVLAPSACCWSPRNHRRRKWTPCERCRHCHCRACERTRTLNELRRGSEARSI